MDKIQKKLDKILDKKNFIIIEIDDEETIKIKVVKTLMGSIKYRTKKINKLLQKIDKLI